jgi:microcystin-dependent protein
MDPFIGQIQAFGFNFPPRGWAFCDGQLLPISQNTALFSLLGTTYGGDGRTTFALPDLRGRSIVHPGNGPGLPPITQGERAGRVDVTLTVNNLPSHNHTLSVLASDSDATLDEAAQGARFGTTSSPIYAPSAAGSVALAADTTSAVGGSQPFNIRNPYLGVYYSIALQGIFPSRN